MNRSVIVVLLTLALTTLACGKNDADKAAKPAAEAVTGESVLKAAKVRELLSGNTLLAHQYSKDKKFVIAHARNGGATSLEGKERKGKWRVTDDGKYCLEWQGKAEKCRFLANDGKGGLVIVNDAYRPVWSVDEIKPGTP